MTGESAVRAEACVFCAITARTEPAEIVHEDDTTVAFLDIAPANQGHVLVVPRVHATDLFSIGVEDAAAVMRTVHRVARMVDETFTPDGLTLFQANRSAGWQDVFHLHIHVVPRWESDDLVRPWRSGEIAAADELRQIGERLRRHR